MSFRQIFDRIARISRAEINGRSSSYEEELRRAQELIDESRGPRRTGVESDESDSRPEPESKHDEVYLRALRTIGVEPSATREQIVAAYRRRAREFHPDRVAHLSQDQQREALRRMQELNLAYEYLERRA